VKGVTAAGTDVRNTERLVELFGPDLRYVDAWSKFVVWNGKQWMVDSSGRAMRCTVETTRVMMDEAINAFRVAGEELAAANGDDGAERDAKARLSAAHRAMAWAVKSQSAPRIAAMLTIAKSSEAIAITHHELDADPWLLNVENGTIDLRTGELRAHRRADHITKLAPVIFDAAAKAPTWDRFIDQAMAGNAALVDFLRRLIGYALTGSIREHALGFFFGGGRNGKSTFLGTIHSMLGDYARPAPRGLLFKSKTERHPTELASLFGARFVTCSEVEAGRSFDEALVKDLTGGDHISARQMREDFWSFAPTHKFFLAGNHKPNVRGDDDGIWRRIRLVPWTVQVPEADVDKELPEKLRAELPGILAWAVRGCLEWQRDGLGEPIEVREATDQYREESDVIGEFFRLRCLFHPEGVVARRMLRESYEVYAKDNGDRNPLGARAFAAKLRERGITETSLRRGLKVDDAWRGVRLQTDQELEAKGRGDVGGAGSEYPLDPKLRSSCGTQPGKSSTAPYDPARSISDWGGE
jgi:putative DNA primase/helicase